MKIKQFEIVNRCLYWKEKKALIIGDLHLGYEDSLKESGAITIFIILTHRLIDS